VDPATGEVIASVADAAEEDARFALEAAAAAAGLPPGVLAVLPTSRPATVAGTVMADPRLRKVPFTGSTDVGRLLLRQAADQMVVSSMELGGNAPFIVCADADLDLAVDGAMAAKMHNGGETCTAANRFYVHHSVADRFADLLAARMSSAFMGPGDCDGVTLGPLVDAAAIEKVDRIVRATVAAGARVVTGGEPVARRVFFYPPTVLLDVPHGSAATREEIFGPVSPITTFQDEAEAVAKANDTPFGLVAYLDTRDLSLGLRVASSAM
jgi:succinate-semialdehyde dehydrogenase/glutarate-semialdehyde dehydrogenase